MKHEKLSQALNEISDEYICKAADKRHRSYAPWFGAVAAVLVVATLVGFLWRPGRVEDPVAGLEDIPITWEIPTEDTVNLPTVILELPPIADNQKYQVAGPMYPKMASYPGGKMHNYEQWWYNVKAIHNQPQGYAESMNGYFKTVLPALLTEDNNKNPVCSPVNIYMALAMLAETTGGESRQQLLDFLGAQSIEALRTQAGHVWNAHYWNDGVTTSILGSALWLDEAYSFDRECADMLAKYYYASSFSGDLGSDEMNAAVQDWLNTQTGGLMEEQAKSMELSPETVFALISTIYYKVGWSACFSEERNTERDFYGSDQKVKTTFMNTTDKSGDYYWGDDYGAVNLRLEDGSRMWFILPDEGVDVNTIIQSGDAWDMVIADRYENQKQMDINLSVPKFKVDAAMELKETLYGLGLTKVLGEQADFSGFVDEAIFVDSISHAVTLEIDEEGVAAAAYTKILVYGSAPPTEMEEIDFVLDRPFIFFIQSADGLPLFAGVVNQI